MPGFRAQPSTSGSGRGPVFDQRSSARSLTSLNEVDATVNSPDQCDSQREQRFHLGAITHERADQVEAHAGQVRKQPKDWNQEMADQLELGMFVETDEAGHATQTVKEERAEVGCQRYG